MTGISIDTAIPEEEEKISLDVLGARAEAPMSPEAARDHAFKVQFALPSLKESYDNIYGDLTEGRRKNLEERAAAAIDTLKYERRYELLKNFAKDKQGPLTPSDIQYVDDAIKEFSAPTDPNTVVQEYFGKEYFKLVRDTGESNPDSMFSQSAREIPREHQKLLEVADTHEAKRQIALTEQHDRQRAVDKQSYFGWGVDQAKTIFPFYTDVKLRGFMEKTPPYKGFLGTNLYEQSRELLRLPVPEFKAKLTEILDYLEKDNPTLAVMFAQAVVGQSTSDRVLNDLYTVTSFFDVPTVGKVGLSLARKLKLFGETTQAVKSATKALEGAEISRPALLEAAGNVERAGVEKAAENMLNDLKGAADPYTRSVNALKSIFRAGDDARKARPGRLGQEIENQIDEANLKNETNFIDKLTTTLRVERLPGVLAVQRAIDDIWQDIKALHKGVHVSDANIIEDPNTTAKFVEFRVTNHDGSLFSQREIAENHAKLYGYYKPIIEQEGAKFYIKLFEPLRESDDAIRAHIATSPETRGQISNVIGEALGKVRTPEETLSLANRAARKSATYGASVFHQVARESMKEVEELAKWTFPWTARRKRYDEWKKVVNAAKEKGRYFDSVGELEEYYRGVGGPGRLPDPQEIRAYFSYKRTMEMKNAYENLNAFKTKSRLGTKTHRFETTGDFSPLSEAGNRQFSDWFDAIRQTEFPKGEGTMLWVGDKVGDERLVTVGRMAPKIAKELKDGFKEGKFQILKLVDEQKRPLRDFSDNVGDKRIQYVISERIETKDLDWNQIPHRPGLFEYEHSHYIKQAKVVKEDITKAIKNIWYEGDTTIMPINIRAMGLDVAKHLDRVRILFRDKDVQGAKAYAEKHLPMEFKEVYGWFHKMPVRSATTGRMEKSRPAMLSLDEPIQLVQRGKLLIDSDTELPKRYLDAKTGKTVLKDGTRQNTLGARYQEFSGERDAHDLYTMSNKGSRANPLYAYEPATTIDPVKSLDRSLSRMIRNTFMDDYKITSIEHWLKEAKDVINFKGERPSAWHFYNPVFLQGADPEITRRLQLQNYQIQQFLGVPSETDGFLYSAAQKLADMVYTKSGQKTVLGIDPAWLLPKLTDPYRFIRASVFHPKLGLFNPAQLMVQAQTFATILGIAGGKMAVPGTYAASLHVWSRINRNPAIIDKLDSLASKMSIPGTSRWKPGEFKEAMELYKSTGFGNVGPEFAIRDSFYAPQVFKRGAEKFLDAGAWFFRAGETFVRDGAWYTAYREFRDKNPTGRITKADTRTILERADLLSVNMSRASNSTLQHGIFSIPTQFLSYQLRTMELMMGKRLSTPVKARLFGTYAALYGAPTAFGLSGLPLGDMIRQNALENDYVVGDNYITSLINEGIPSMLLSLITGNFYNIGDRYGVQGFESLREALHGDKTMLDIAGGAAYSTWSNTFASLSGFGAAIQSAIRQDGRAFPVKFNDAMDVFKEISSVNSAWRLLAALDTGRWMTKKEGDLGEVSKTNAFFMTISGLQLQSMTDLHNKAFSKKRQQEKDAYVLKRFIQEFRRAAVTYKDNPDQARDFFTRAFTWLDTQGYPEDKRMEAITIATKGHESMVDRMDKDFYTKNIPGGQYRTRMDSYIKTLKLKPLGE